jgi:hypothetical protein
VRRRVGRFATPIQQSNALGRFLSLEERAPWEALGWSYFGRGEWVPPQTIVRGPRGVDHAALALGLAAAFAIGLAFGLYLHP